MSVSLPRPSILPDGVHRQHGAGWVAWYWKDGASSPDTHRLIDLHDLAEQRYPYLCDSSAPGGPENARYAILFAFPGRRLTYHHGAVKDSGPGPQLMTKHRHDFLRSFNDLWQHEAKPYPMGQKHTLPFVGGWFIYCGYELVGTIEPCLNLPDAAIDLPTALAVRIPAAIIYDYHTGNYCLVVEDARADTLLPILWEDLQTVSQTNRSKPADLTITLHEDEPAPYLLAAQACRDYIQAGDIFQANLSRAWRADLHSTISDADLFRRLQLANPAPFGALARFDQATIISSSPERLIKSRQGRLDTRPIAGTRPRGSSALIDINLSDELLAHPKERAEHLMLVDLERNDLSRVCIPGSVLVDEMMTIESYPWVHHIVSNICGTLTPQCRPGDIIRAIFPGGTITGCPKVRCVEILAEMEQVGRGPYTGSLGYVGHDGSLDMNILIRTMVRDNQSIHFRAGGGIVADSEPKHELEETRAKARGLIQALR